MQVVWRLMHFYPLFCNKGIFCKIQRMFQQIHPSSSKLCSMTQPINKYRVGPCPQTQAKVPTYLNLL